MPTTNYTDIESVKARLDRVDTSVDAILANVVSAASRQIDAVANRRFYQLSEVRYFTAPGGSWLEVDDLVSITSLSTDISGTRTWETAWAVTDYDLTPDNAAGIGFPYTAIRQRPFTSRWFPTLRKGVKVDGTWGWPAIPPEIVEATILQSVRIYSRKNTPYGVAGQGDFGRIALIPRVDPDVLALVSPYVRQTIGAI